MTEEYGHIPDGFLLNPEEVEDLRKQKHELTEYAKEKLRKLIYEQDMKKMKDAIDQKVLDLMNNQEPYPDEMFEEVARREAENKRPFYRFFAIDYLATGEGRSYWLMICRNYQGIGGKDREKEKFINFIGMSAKHYMECFEELAEEEFMKKYDTLIPPHVKVHIHRRDQPAFTWETHLHFNYS